VEFFNLQAAMSEASLIVHGPPDLPDDVEVLGAYGVSKENSEMTKYGWMLNDFLSWMLLFNQRGHSQGQEVKD
jgi:hypothetical protein